MMIWNRPREKIVAAKTIDSQAFETKDDDVLDKTRVLVYAVAKSDCLNTGVGTNQFWRLTVKARESIFLHEG